MEAWIAKRDPEMDGEVCFTDTRVPVKTLFDYLKDGKTVIRFLEDFPTVTPKQADALLQYSFERILAQSAA